MKQFKKIPHDSVIVCKSIIKDLTKDIKFTTSEIIDNSTKIMELSKTLVDLKAVEDYKNMKLIDKELQKVQLKLIHLYNLRDYAISIRKFYEKKCRELREMNNKMNYHERKLKMSTNKLWDILKIDPVVECNEMTSIKEKLDTYDLSLN